MNIAANVASPQLYDSQERTCVRIPAGQGNRVCMTVNCSALLTYFKWVRLFAIDNGLQLKFTLDDTRETIIRKDT